MYELFNSYVHGSGANIWIYFWEIIETSELGNEVFSNNNNNSSSKNITSFWIAAFRCPDMALGADLWYHWISAAEKLVLLRIPFRHIYWGWTYRMENLNLLHMYVEY